MVRTTIACARCRRYKVKCVHTGTPPCRGCAKADPDTCKNCVLSGPVLSKKKKQHPSSAPDVSRPRPPRRTVGPNPPDNSSTTAEHNDQIHPRPALGGCILEPSLVLQAGAIFKDKFPEVPFLHMSTFRNLVRRADRHDDNSGPLPVQGSSRFGRATALCAALVAISLPLIDPEAPRDQYVNTAKEIVSSDDSMDIYMVQALIVLSIYEWGYGKPRKAWIYSGMAIRSMQLISSMADSDKCTELQQEIYNRTFWSCFVLDRLIFCGKPQPPALPLASIDTHWPSRDTDFAFGVSGIKLYPNNSFGIQSASVVESIDGYFALLAEGVDIWAEILKWIVSGGRRRLNVVTVKEAPWLERSQWRRMYQRLDDWRHRHGTRIRFPDVGVDGHVSFRGGDGEAFAYINLIYYVSILFLCREYIPFLPTAASRPSGPVDPPLLDDPAPLGWWEERASELFSASSNITRLVGQLKEEGAPIITPFAGFCAFSAATINIYIACFPQMNLGRSRGREADFERDLAYLDEFQKRWPMGAGWWATIQRTKDLYQRASADRSRFEGKTRDDFVNLETSIYDCTGTSPKDDDDHSSVEGREKASEVLPEPVNHQAAMSLQELSRSGTARGQYVSTPQVIPDWNELWSLWGDYNIAPFGVEGSSYEYSFEFQDGNMTPY